MPTDTGDIIRGAHGLRAPQQFKLCSVLDLALLGPWGHSYKVGPGKKICLVSQASPLPAEAGQLNLSPQEPPNQDTALFDRRKGTTSSCHTHKEKSP